MASGWTAEMTRALVSVWGQANVQSELDGVVRNRTIFERISRELKEMGIHRTWQQCRTKIKTLHSFQTQKHQTQKHYQKQQQHKYFSAVRHRVQRSIRLQSRAGYRAWQSHDTWRRGCEYVLIKV